MGLVGAAPLGEPGDSPEMDGGIEQNPAYGTAQAFIYADYDSSSDVLTLTHTLTDRAARQDCLLIFRLA
jgi:hypothetical protein